MNNWGPNTWKYLHTYTIHINEKHFIKHRNDIIGHLVKVATNLPCPICSTHAKEYLNNRTLHRINNKEALVKLFFDFHNQVNKNKHKSQETVDILNSYQHNSIRDCARVYLQTWVQSSKSRYLNYSNSFTRKLYLNHFREFFNKYQFVFEE
jgi:hypothetical protein